MAYADQDALEAGDLRALAVDQGLAPA